MFEFVVIYHMHCVPLNPENFVSGYYPVFCRDFDSAKQELLNAEKSYHAGKPLYLYEGVEYYVTSRPVMRRATPADFTQHSGVTDNDVPWYTDEDLDRQAQASLPVKEFTAPSPVSLFISGSLEAQCAALVVALEAVERGSTLTVNTTGINNWLTGVWKARSATVRAMLAAIERSGVTVVVA